MSIILNSNSADSETLEMCAYDARSSLTSNESGCDVTSDNEKSTRKDSMESIEDCLRNLKANLSFDSPERWLFVQPEDKAKSSENSDEGDDDTNGDDGADDDDDDDTNDDETESEESRNNVSSDSEACRYLTDSSTDESNEDDEIETNYEGTNLETSNQGGDNQSMQNVLSSPQTNDFIRLVSFDVSPKRIRGRAIDSNVSNNHRVSMPSEAEEVECSDAECSLCRDVFDEPDGESSIERLSHRPLWHNSSTISSSKLNSSKLNSSKLNVLRSGLVQRMRSASLRAHRHPSNVTDSANKVESELNSEIHAKSSSNNLSSWSLRKLFRGGKKSSSLDVVSPCDSVINSSIQKHLESSRRNSSRPVSYCDGYSSLRGLSEDQKRPRVFSAEDSGIESFNRPDGFKESFSCSDEAKSIVSESCQRIDVHNSASCNNATVETLGATLPENDECSNPDANQKSYNLTKEPAVRIESDVQLEKSRCSTNFEVRKLEQFNSRNGLNSPYITKKQNKKCSMLPENIAAIADKFAMSNSFVTTRPPRKSEVDRVSERMQQAEKMKKKRKQVLKELVDTEMTYQNHLDLVIRLFEEPLCLSHLLEDHIIVTIFGNIRQIISVNEELVKHLGTMDVGRAFLRVSPFLKVYSTYANNHERALATLMDWNQKSVEFSQFRRQQEELEEMNGLKLNALLITPVQRIPRYKLLLEELLTCTDSTDIEHVSIQEAVAQVSEVANHINDHIKQQDNFMKMIAIQKSLACSVGPRIIVPGRVFIKEGRLMKVSSRGGRSYERMFFLFSDMLMYAKPRLLDGGGFHSYICCCILPLHHCKAQRVLGHGKGQGALFTIQCKQESLLLYSDQKTVDSWMAVLLKAVDEHNVNRQTLRKNSSAKEPVRRSGIIRLWKKERQDDPLTNRIKSSQDRSILAKPQRNSPLIGCRGRTDSSDSSFASRKQNKPENSIFRSKFGRSGHSRSCDQENVDPDVSYGKLHDSAESSGNKTSGSKPSTPMQQLWDNFGCLTPRSKNQQENGTLPYRPTTADDRNGSSNTFSFYGHCGQTIDLETAQN